MKKLLLIILLALSTSAIAQDKIPWDDNGEVTFIEVVQVNDGADANKLYLRARQWFSETYRAANEVLQMDDKEGGVLIGKAHTTIKPQGVEHRLYYTIKIFLKDGRYKYEITDLLYENGGSRYNNYTTTKKLPSEIYSDEHLLKKNGKEKAYNAAFRDQTIINMEALIATLKKALDDTTPVVEVDKGDDW